MQCYIILRHRFMLRRSGDYMDFVPSIAKRARQPKHVGSDTTQPLLRGILIRNEPDSHAHAIPPCNLVPRVDLTTTKEADASMHVSINRT